MFNTTQIFSAVKTSSISLWGPLCFAIFLVAAWVIQSRPRRRRGTSLMLVGVQNAGKTALLSRLAYCEKVATTSSMQVNIATTVLPGTPTYFKIIDIPGHPSLRGQFKDYLAETKVVAFVFDANSVSRNAPAVAEHLHHVLHALTTLPPSHRPSLLILAHKYDLLKNASSKIAQEVVVYRARTVLERELEIRRVSQAKGVVVDGLGEDGERTDMGGLECGENQDSPFTFDTWGGGEVTILGTSTEPGGAQFVLNYLL